MNNQFQYFGNKIYVLPKNMATNYLVSRYNCIIYIQEIKYNKNGLLVYSLNKEKESDQNFNLNENDIIQTQNTTLKLIIKTNFFSLSNSIYQQIQNQVFFLKNYLCVVYGLQFKYLNQNKTSWYTVKLVKLFLKHKSFLIQITDCGFLIKPILKDLKHVLNGPIFYIIDFISLSKLRNNLYEHLSIFFKSSVLIFKTFILQMEEDGEEVLTKIKETDVFRRQKPGTISFFKKKIIHYEDENYSEFRYLKRKTRSFFKMIALLILPFIIYRTNQKNYGKLSLPKLAYVMFNSNKGKIQYSHPNQWNDFLGCQLSRTNIQKTITSKHINKLMHSHESDRARIRKLWNANTNNLHFESFINLYDEEKMLSKIDALLFGQIKMNRAFYLKKSSYINIYSKKKHLHNLNEHNISQNLIKYALFLIKPRDIIWNNTISIDHRNDIFVLNNNDIIKNTDGLSNTKVGNLVNQFHNLLPNRLKKYFQNENLDLNYTKQLFLFQQINKGLNQNKIISSIKPLFYQKKHTSIRTITSSNGLLEANILDISYNLNLPPTQTLLKGIYINEVISLIQNLLKQYIENTRNDILNCFNLALGMSKISFQDLNREFKYTTSLMNWNDKGSYSQELEFDSNFKFIQANINKEMIVDFYNKNFQYVKLLVPHLCVTSQSNFVSNFDMKGINKSLFMPLLKNIDTLYEGLSNDWHNSRIYDIDIEINKIMFLLYPYFFEKNYTIYNSTQFLHNIRNLNRSFVQEIKENIICILSKEQKQTYIIWHQFNQKIKHFDLKNTRLSYNKYHHCHDLFYKRSEIPSVQFLSSLNFNQLSQRSNILNNFENQILVNQHDGLNSKNLWYSLTNIFKNYVQLNSLLKIHNDIYIDQEDVVNQLNAKELSHSRVNSSQDSILNVYISNQIEIIKQYIPWLFTSEWWAFVKHANQKIGLIILQDIYDSVYLSMLPITRYIRDKSNIISHDMHQHIIDNNFDKSKKLQEIHLFVEKQLKKSFYDFPLSIWERPGVSSFRINIWSYVGSIISLSSLYWFSFVLGGSSFMLWVMFERIRDLVNLSWNKELDILVLANLRQNQNPNLAKQPIKRKNRLQEQYYLSLRKWSIWFRLLYSKYFGSKIQAIWLYNIRKPDMYTGQRELAFQLVVGETNLLGLTLYNLDEKLRHYFGYQSIRQEGLNYFKQLTTARYKWYTHPKLNLLNHQRFIPFAFYKNHSASEELWELNASGIVKKKYLPISLQLSELYSKGILLIGSQDTGKSFLVKSLAGDADLPFIYIAVDRLIDILEFEDEMLESDSSLYFLRENIIRFNTITNFIQKLGSCVIWIPNIETIHDSWNYKSKIKEQCTLLILRYLLQNITAILNNHKHILFFASCENTSYLDPGFVSAKRFSRFVNLRLPNNSRRPQIFAQFLKNKGLEIKSKLRWYAEFSNSTMGFTLRDLSVLANEAFLLSIQAKRKFLTIDDIRLVLYRGLKANETSRVETSLQTDERIQYKIGRAIVQNTLVRPNPMIPLRVRYDLWKPRFYYLSKAYLQSDYSQSTLTQLQIVPHILNCLAGSAARDAWLFFNKRILKEDSYYFNTEIEHDLTLAVNLFEGIFKEFAYLDIYEKTNEDSIFIPQFKRMHNLVFLDQGNDVPKQAVDQYQNTSNISTYKQDISCDFPDHLEDILPDISWCSRTERLSLSRNVLFDLLKRVDEPLSLFSSVRFLGKASFNTMFLEKEKPYDGHYHRSWDVMKLQIAKDLDYIFYGMLSKQRIITMGLPITSDQLMEYEPSENNVLFFWGRPIWNPAATFLRNLVFRQRQLLANEELLSILYIVNQAQHSRPLIPAKTKGKEGWTPDIYLENLSMKTQVKKIAKNSHCFSRFKSLAYSNATFQRPQPEIPSNSELSFIKRFVASNRFSRFSFTEDIFYQQNILKHKNLKTEELLTYGSILESYHYLLNFFIRKQHLLKNITNLLIEKGVLYEEDIQNTID